MEQSDHKSMSELNPPKPVFYESPDIAKAEFRNSRGVAQLGLERLLWEQEVGGSNPLTPTSIFILKSGGRIRSERTPSE